MRKIVGGEWGRRGTEGQIDEREKNEGTQIRRDIYRGWEVWLKQWWKFWNRMEKTPRGRAAGRISARLCFVRMSQKHRKSPQRGISKRQLRGGAAMQHSLDDRNKRKLNKVSRKKVLKGTAWKGEFHKASILFPPGSDKALEFPGVNINMSTSCGKQHPLTMCSLALPELLLFGYYRSQI